jgi:hypothetical protein
MLPPGHGAKQRARAPRGSIALPVNFLQKQVRDDRAGRSVRPCLGSLRFSSRALSAHHGRGNLFDGIGLALQVDNDL